MAINGVDLTKRPTDNNQKKMHNFKNTNWTWIKKNTQNPLRINLNPTKYAKVHLQEFYICLPVCVHICVCTWLGIVVIHNTASNSSDKPFLLYSTKSSLNRFCLWENETAEIKKMDVCITHHRFPGNHAMS